MQLTHLGHAAVLVESAGRRILIDPGNFSTAWHDLTALDAICITHQHPDHVDPEHLPGLVDANPQAELLVEADVALTCDLPGMQRVRPGEHRLIGDVTLDAVGSRHAIIHNDIPRIGNIGFVIGGEGVRFFHPGDALDAVPDNIDAVAIPVYGPWAAMKETIDFVRAVGAPVGFPIHDGLLNERGFALIFGRINSMTPTQVVDLRGGLSMDCRDMHVSDVLPLPKGNAGSQ